jgi:hypothetical protein
MTLVDLSTDPLELSVRDRGEDDLVTRSLREQLRLAREAPRSAAEQFHIGSVGKAPVLEEEEEEEERLRKED